ncbi:hypothetical protein AAFF_G00084800 [Aldrovandia affinis]|uniref:Uncharacterized protein n=1 Tax=Aldrovandia affinis TaxID=143900 RepID=A0AAD7RX27_9TELE|nr:hypothetical protein AAFF_G00084800 [Aldrovandia affinis]
MFSYVGWGHMQTVRGSPAPLYISLAGSRTRHRQWPGAGKHKHRVSLLSPSRHTSGELEQDLGQAQQGLKATLKNIQETSSQWLNPQPPHLTTPREPQIRCDYSPSAVGTRAVHGESVTACLRRDATTHADLFAKSIPMHAPCPKLII